MSTATKEQAQANMPKLKWDTSKLASNYANVCNVSSTREEMVFIFGVNQAWERTQRELEIQLTNRVIMSPHAAKRLSMLLNNVVGEYESRYGELQVTEGKPTEVKNKAN